MRTFERALAAIMLWLALAIPALAQSNPGLRTGQIPTAAQWNSYFSAKQDYLGFTPLNPSSVAGLSPIVSTIGGGVVTISCPTCLSSGTLFANPTGTIGGTAVNGSAVTAMRSDAAPALPQLIYTPSVYPEYGGVNGIGLFRANQNFDGGSTNRVRLGSADPTVFPGTVTLSGTVTVGNVLTISLAGTFTGSPQLISHTIQSGDTTDTIAQAFAKKITTNPAYQKLIVAGGSGSFTNGETVTATGGGTGIYSSSLSWGSVFVITSAVTTYPNVFTGTLTGGTSGATRTITGTIASVTAGIDSQYVGITNQFSINPKYTVLPITITKSAGTTTATIVAPPNNIVNGGHLDVGPYIGLGRTLSRTPQQDDLGPEIQLLGQDSSGLPTLQSLSIGLTFGGAHWNTIISNEQSVITFSDILAFSTNTAESALVLGAVGSSRGVIYLRGNTAGTLTLKPPASITSYEFVLPSTAGTAGWPLLSGGGAEMTYGSISGAGAFVLASGATLTSPTINTPTIAGGTVNGLTSFSLRDSSAAFDLTIAATSSPILSAGRTLVLDMGNVAHTISFGTTANTITFPNVTSDTVVMLAAAQTLTNKTLTSPTLNSPTITGGTANGLTSFSLRSSGAAFDLTIQTSEVLTASRSLNIVMGDVNRTLTFGGNITTAGAFITSGANSLTLTTTGATNVTLPTSGTLATTAGASIPAGVQGDVPYYSGTNILTVLNKTATANSFIRNSGTSNNPAWSTIACADLSDDGVFCSSTDAANLSGTVASARISGSYTGITGVGTLTAGATGAGFTIALGTSTITGDLPFANLTQIAGLSVLGVTGSSTSDVAAITAGTDGHVLRRASSSSLGFGTLVAGSFATGPGIVTPAMLDNGSALSLLGRSANSSGARADITASAASDCVFRESGSALACGTIATAGIASAAVTYAKIANLGALAVMGRSANSSGVGADIPATATSDAVLRESGSTIGFGTIATAGIANNAVTVGKLAQAAANTMRGNWTGSTANIADNAMPSCPDSGTNHLNYVSGTGIICGISGGSGSGTVTSIATTSPITGGTITTTGTIACATCVTSAAALTANSLMAGDGSQASKTVTTGTGVVTALGVNVGSAGAFVTFNGALGTPSSGTVTNLTGTASININGTVGATTQNTGQFTSLAYSTTLTGTSTNAAALAVGRQGATNPVLNVDASTASVVTGLNIKGAAAAGGLALSVITSGTNENLTINAAGSGTITLGSVSTGAIVHTTATTLSAALTYGGVALSNAVTGTGNMVLSASPTLTGTLTAATVAATTINAFTLGGAITGGANSINNAKLESSTGVGINITANRTNGLISSGGAGNTLFQFVNTTTGTAAGDGFIFGLFGGSGDMQFLNQENAKIIFATNNTERFYINADGSMRWLSYGAGTLSTDASGNITASDERLKNIRGHYERGLEAVQKINPILFSFKTTPEILSAGLSAQNIRAVLGEEAVGQNRNGYLNVDDRAVIAALVNAVKELASNATINLQELKAANDNLRAEIARVANGR